MTCRVHLSTLRRLFLQGVSMRALARRYGLKIAAVEAKLRKALFR